jgi:DNA polymerase-4
MSSTIHVDMDAFYASVEKLDNPDLKEKPLIVGGMGKRGVVSTASYEARKHGVKSAMPMSRARKLCPQGIYLPHRFERYREISRKVREIFLSYTPRVEPISLDEAFLDLSEATRSFEEAVKTARKIKEDIKEEIGLTCSVGVAPNKFLAKLASGLQKPDGFTVIEEKDIDQILKNLPVGKIWGVGEVTEKKLAEMSIYTIGQLKQVPLRRLKDAFGKQGKNLYRLARGIDESLVEPQREAKSISHEITFEEDLRDPEKIKDYLLTLSEGLGRSLRKNRLRARTVKIKVRYSDFTTITRQITLDSAISSTEVIKEIAKALFEKRTPRDRRVRLIGLGVSNLTEMREEQLLLFEASTKLRS